MTVTDRALARVRYRHLGPDPVAKQLYATLVAAVRAVEQAEAAITQYLDEIEATQS